MRILKTKISSECIKKLTHNITVIALRVDHFRAAGFMIQGVTFFFGGRMAGLKDEEVESHQRINRNFKQRIMESHFVLQSCSITRKKCKESEAVI